jgi:restriction system protein
MRVKRSPDTPRSTNRLQNLQENPEDSVTTKNLSLSDAAVRVLTAAGEPLHYREITKRMLEQGLVESNSKTPDASLSAVLAVDLQRHGKASRFVRVGPAVYGLRSWDADAAAPSVETVAEADDEQQRVRIPLFPLYSELRLVLPVWDGRPRSAITHLRATIGELRGTPQDPVDWTSPDEWIPKRLTGEDQTLAMAIWQESGKLVNPRHTYGHWLLARGYHLLDESAEGILQLTEHGRDFVKNPGGATEVLLDESEGLLKLLVIVSGRGPARVGELEDEWREYLARHSRVSSDTTIKNTLRLRLRNLLERQLIARSSAQYTVTDDGLAYLSRVDGQDAPGASGEPQIHKMLNAHNASIRDSVHAILSSMDPIALEHLVKRLLIAMNYDNVSVTTPTNDKGVDVEADIELGITSVHEVIQVKRHKKTIQRKDLDALRGSLHRFGAVRGTLITTGTFSRGTREAAFESGVAPITLIDGDKLVDLMIEHGVGVRRDSLTMLEIDHDEFARAQDALSESE